MSKIATLKPDNARTFTYASTPPRVPSSASFGYQRWFVTAFSNPVGSPLTLLRHADEDHAKLTVEHGAGDVRIDLAVNLTAAQLRDLATHLLRAADDIDAHPAAEWSGS